MEERQNSTEIDPKHWPSKDVFWEGVKKTMLNDGESLKQQLVEIGIEEQLIPILVEVTTSATYVYQLFKQVFEFDKKVKSELIWSGRGIKDGTLAQVSPNFSVGGVPVESKEELATRVKNGETVDLDNVEIAVNLSSLLRRIKTILRNYDVAQDLYPDDSETAETFLKDSKDELIQRLMKAIVEELGHALFMHTHSKSQAMMEKLTDYFGAYQSYIPGKEGPLDILTDEELRKLDSSYTNNPIEKKAAVLVDIFSKKYLSEGN